MASNDSALPHDNVVRLFDQSKEDLNAARERCGDRLKHALVAQSSEDKIAHGLDAADAYLHDAFRIIDKVETLKREYPEAWNESTLGQAQRAHEAAMRQAIVDAALMALFGGWCDTED